MSPRPSASPAPFGAHDYQIILLPADAPRQVSIQARAALPLQVGERYTVGHDQVLYDLIVDDISHLADGLWCARCSVTNGGAL
jgi:hypothetical protein